MIEQSKIKKYLHQELSTKRYRHSINVSKEAVKLAKYYGADVEKAEIAGLVHDCTREISKSAHLDYIHKSGMKLDEISIELKELLHGQTAAYVCKELFQIYDEDILSAVRCHTTGKENMNTLDKIIFLADYIEPDRCFKEVNEVRSIAYVNIDRAVLKALDFTIMYIVFRHNLIHPDTVLARNYIIQRLGRLD